MKITSNKQSQEKYEAQTAELFLDLFNKQHGTDYKVGPAEPQQSIVDRRGISSSGKYEDLKLQFKRVKKWDIKTVKKFRQAQNKKSKTNVKAFDLNIFKHLHPTIKKAHTKYKDHWQVSDIVLVLEVSATEEWMRHWKKQTKEDFSAYPFKGIYCIPEPSATSDTYLFPLKEVTPIQK